MSGEAISGASAMKRARKGARKSQLLSPSLSPALSLSLSLSACVSVSVWFVQNGFNYYITAGYDNSRGYSEDLMNLWFLASDYLNTVLCPDEG